MDEVERLRQRQERALMRGIGICLARPSLIGMALFLYNAHEPARAFAHHPQPPAQGRAEAGATAQRWRPSR